jgi:hypothetical protein
MPKQTTQSFAIQCKHKWKTDTANIVKILLISTGEFDIALQFNTMQ